VTEPEDFARLDALLEAALDRPAPERAAYVAEACAGDARLLRRLERLVALAEGSDQVLPASGGLSGPVWDEVAREMDDARPELRAGDRLGRYEVRGVLGRGGMGHVYRAFDPALGREVAVKALALAWTGGAPELRRRLEREARLMATISHPNVAAIHGFEVIEGAPCLILELVEGPTLAERLRRGPLPLETTVAVALQIAAALEEAHRKGVIHRDLTPANIKLGPDGRVKVLDFGIAKAVAPGPDEAALSGALEATTGPGAILGTAAYMSPEQVRGEPVDTRTDVWAFGCVLYAMLAGRAVFGGASAAEVMAAVLRDDVDWRALPAGTPEPIRRLLRRCLRRDPRERLQDIGDARLELADGGHEGAEAVPPPRRPARAAPWLAAAVVASASALAVSRFAARPAEPPVRLSLELPAGVSVSDDFANPLALAEDGSRVVVLAAEGGVARLYRRDLASVETRPIAGTEGAWQPFLSPDGREVAFFADRKLKRVAVAGGPVATLAEIGGNPRGGAWAPDGTLLLAPSLRSGLARVDARGGKVVPVTQLDLARGEGSHRWPQVLPGGEWALFTAGVETTFDDARVEALSLRTGERRVLVEGGSYGRYAAGRLFFAREGRAFALPFDAGRAAVTGAPELAVDGVRYDPRSGAASFALAGNGTLAYLPAAPTSREHALAWVDDAGRLARIGGSPRRYSEPRLSPDGRRIAVRIGNTAEADVWIVDAASATLSRVSSGLSPHRPVWTPDGRGITVGVEQQGRFKLLTLPATGGGTPAAVLESAHRVLPNAWSPDGRVLVYQELTAASGWDLKAVEAGAGRAPRTLLATRFDERNASFSPDGLFLAYESNEPDNVFEVYVARVAEPRAKVWGTVTGARWARWGRDGQFYYWRPTQARPGESRVAEGLHRVDWRQGRPDRGVARTGPVWGDGRHLPPSLSGLVVALYAAYDVDVSGPAPRFLVLDSTTSSSPPPLRHPILALNGFGAPRAGLFR
jgi:serine/threonine-protein kinase